MPENIDEIKAMRERMAQDTELLKQQQGQGQRVRYIDHLMNEQKRAHHNISILDKLVQLIESSDDVKLFIELSEQLGTRL